MCHVIKHVENVSHNILDRITSRPQRSYNMIKIWKSQMLSVCRFEMPVTLDATFLRAIDTGCNVPPCLPLTLDGTFLRVNVGLLTKSM
jgi:hypothetical protein